MNVEDEDRAVGERAEEVASWYFRLNGFLSVPGFVVHPARSQEHPYTEADLMAVRFPHSVEKISGIPMSDASLLTKLAGPKQTLFVLIEAKAGTCRINPAWTEEWRENMQRAVRRLGFAEEFDVDSIAQKMYQFMRWEDDNHVLQYITVGKRTNSDLSERYESLVQVTWEDIGDFLYYRFKEFPQKLRLGQLTHPQWPKFGREYSEYVQAARREQSKRATQSYIRTGSLYPDQ